MDSGLHEAWNGAELNGREFALPVSGRDYRGAAGISLCDGMDHLLRSVKCLKRRCFLTTVIALGML